MAVRLIDRYDRVRVAGDNTMGVLAAALLERLVLADRRGGENTTAIHQRLESGEHGLAIALRVRDAHRTLSHIVDRRGVLEEASCPLRAGKVQ